MWDIFQSCSSSQKINSLKMPNNNNRHLKWYLKDRLSVPKHYMERERCFCCCYTQTNKWWCSLRIVSTWLTSLVLWCVKFESKQCVMWRELPMILQYFLCFRFGHDRNEHQMVALCLILASATSNSASWLLPLRTNTKLVLFLLLPLGTTTNLTFRQSWCCFYCFP